MFNLVGWKQHASTCCSFLIYQTMREVTLKDKTTTSSFKNMDMFFYTITSGKMENLKKKKKRELIRVWYNCNKLLII